MSNLSTKGDLLERLNYTFIKENLPNYELIWDKFVSVNFKLNSDKETLKQLISEYNYTCLESVICMETINKKKYKSIIGENADSLTEEQLLSNYISFINDFFVYEAHMGRIFETLVRMWALLRMKEDDKMKEFYHQRHNVIHSHKLPLQFHNNFIAIPELQAQGIQNGWTDKEKFTWDDFLSDSKYVQAIDDYFNDTTTRLISSLNISFSSIMSKLKEIIIDWEVKDAQIYNPNFDPLSGTTMTINYTFTNEI